MPSARPSNETEKRIALLFPPGEQELVRSVLLEECGTNLPGLSNLDEVQLERFRFAVLKLSNGDLNRLQQVVEVAKADWRDLLMAAGFGSADAHKIWLPKQLW